jgi:predicted amidohydrolase
MKVAVGQFAPSGDLADNLATIERLAAQCAREGAEVLVLPEESMATSDCVEGSLAEFAVQYWPEFVIAVCECAKRHALTLITVGYEPGEGLPYNTVIAASPAGQVVAQYRKTHLYDAFAYRESDYVQRGTGTPVVIDVGEFRVGLINCYDLRFPEFTRALVDAGANVISVSAAWVSGAMKEEHWEVLLQARAIESTAWVLAAGSSASGCIGQSMIFDPMGVKAAGLGAQPEGFLVVPITMERLDEVRAILPVLANRVLRHAQG